MQRAANATLVLVTHNAELAGRARRVILLQEGRVVESTHVLPVFARSSRIEDRAPTAPGSATVPSPLSEAVPPRPLGSGLRRFAFHFAAWTALVVAGLLALDLAVASLQRRAAAQRQAKRSALERAALQQLRADVEDRVAVGPDAP